jgi:hypothetical protein
MSCSSSSLSEFAGERFEADESGEREGNWSLLAADSVDVLAAVFALGLGPSLDFALNVLEDVDLRGLVVDFLLPEVEAELEGRGGLKGLGGIFCAPPCLEGLVGMRPRESVIELKCVRLLASLVVCCRGSAIGGS